MPLLTSLVPSLRELRSSLMSGLIWLAAIWVFASARPWSGDIASFGRRVAALGGWAGQAVAFGAILFAAFLVGTASRTLTQPALIYLRKRGIDRHLRERVAAYEPCKEISESDKAAIFKTRQREARFEISQADATLLVSSNSIHDKLDVLWHEAEMRFAVVLPLACLTGLLAWRVWPWFTLGFALIASVAWQSYTRMREWVDAVAATKSLVPALDKVSTTLRHLDSFPNSRLSRDGRAALTEDGKQIVDAPPLR